MTPDGGQRRVEPTATGPRGASRPRVVIFEVGSEASVEVVELPTIVEVGSTFRHRNASWRVVGERPHSRVLIASPLEH